MSFQLSLQINWCSCDGHSFQYFAQSTYSFVIRLLTYSYNILSMQRQLQSIYQRKQIALSILPSSRSNDKRSTREVENNAADFLRFPLFSFSYFAFKVRFFFKSREQSLESCTLRESESCLVKMQSFTRHCNESDKSEILPQNRRPLFSLQICGLDTSCPKRWIWKRATKIIRVKNVTL